MTNTPTLDLWALLPCTTAHLGPLSPCERALGLTAQPTRPRYSRLVRSAKLESAGGVGAGYGCYS